MHSFSHKTHSFRHNLNRASDQNNSLTKVVQLYSSIKEMLSETKICIHMVKKYVHFVTIQTELQVKTIL